MGRNDFVEGMFLIDSTWAFKIKFYPDGRMQNFKCHFCARGHAQFEGFDFFETYSLVVQLTTIHLMSSLQVLLKLKLKQGDVIAAFLCSKMGKNNVFCLYACGIMSERKGVEAEVDIVWSSIYPFLHLHHGT